MIRDPSCASIYFFVKGKRYAYRAWPYVPRIGEEVMLKHPKKGVLVPYLVKSVVYGVEPVGKKQDLGMQAVNIVVEEIKD